MKKIITSVFAIFFIAQILSAHNGSIRGSVQDGATKSPLFGAIVTLEGTEKQAYTDDLGFYQFNDLEAGTYKIIINYLGYELLTESVEVRDSETSTVRSFLKGTPIELQAVVISPEPEVNRRIVSSLDIHLRPTNTSQDILRMVPGLFIAQHAGGGKAEQIFLRGFDIDHGTDISLNVDGMPVNMVSHAHGQGYADLHFLIPETVERVQFAKGPYYAPYGNLATAGYVGFQTKNAIDKSMIKLQAGQFDTYRAVGMFNLLDQSQSNRSQNAYLATEYFFSNGYFDSPQAYNRFSALLKYNTALNNNHYLSASLSSFSSRWDASGQIPNRAVESRQIGRFGAIDDTEGGNTSRTNANFQLISLLDDGSSVRNQFYFSHYDFELYSNFTFFLNNPIDGDQIKQKENRNIFGYNGAYQRSDEWAGTQWQTEFGLNFRRDGVKNNELSRTKGRQATLERLALGDVDEINVGVYVDETIRIGKFLTLNAGVRFDQFQFLYIDRLKEGYDRQIASANIVSPKLNAYFTINDRLQLFANSGSGFHSNDTRVVVTQNGKEILPRAIGVEAGAMFKLTPRFLLSTSVWNLDLEQEFVYVGDEAVVEPSGETRRRGLDIAGRWQLLNWLFADFDVNYTFARAKDAPENEDFIPLAAEITSIGGLTFEAKNGMNGSLRYRYLGDRPANEDNSVIAKGYFLMDAVINYTKSKYEIGFSIQNLLNRDWNEAQFDTESRLFNEAEPVSEIHFTPGTPFNLNVYFSYFF